MNKTDLRDILEDVVHLVIKAARDEKGYVYFKKFISDNDHDIRVAVIGAKAFAIKRMVRIGDFKA